MSKDPYPVFSRDDLSAFWALFADNLANMIIVSGYCSVVLGLPAWVVLGRILPGLGVALLGGLGFYSWLARRVARQTGRTDITALPYGISTPILFVYLFVILKPVQDAALSRGLDAEAAGMLAWQVGVAAAFLGGVIELAGALVGPWLRRNLPRAGMLGTLGGIALVWIATVPLAEIFEHPLVGFTSLSVILAGLVARYRLPFGIPAGLAAITLGTAVGFATGEASVSVDGIGIYPPIPVIGDLWVGLREIARNPWIFAVVVPAEIYNFIETMNNVESAEAAGDSYPVGTCQVADGLGTILGALFGSPFPTTVYIGHPGYKRLGARAGYALGVGVVFFLAASFGVVSLLHALIPFAAVAPMLVFIGMVITAQAFRASPEQHAVAVALAMVPHVSSLLVAKWMSLAKVTAGSAGALFDPKLVTAMLREGAHVTGQAALSNGSILVGMLWGSLAAFLLDGRPAAALVVSLAGGALTLPGMIHSGTLAFQMSPIAGGYVLVAALCLALWLTGSKPAPGKGEL